MSSYKKLNANDIRITPFEAHKRYVITDTNLGSFKASIHSASWTGSNKVNFDEENYKHYQIDHLYYRDYINQLGNKNDISDHPYTYQERKLYGKAKILSLSQTTFGSEVMPNTFNVTGSFDGSNTKISDDGFGNLVDATDEYSTTITTIISSSTGIVDTFTIATGSLFSIRILGPLPGDTLHTITSFSIADFSNPANSFYTGSTLQGAVNFINYALGYQLSASLYNGALQLTSSFGESWNGALITTGTLAGSYGTGSVMAGGVNDVTYISSSVGSNNNFVDERRRVFYLAPLNGYKKTNPQVDYTTGLVNPNDWGKDKVDESTVFYDDSYYQNTLTYHRISFKTSNGHNIGDTSSPHPKPFRDGDITFMEIHPSDDDPTTYNEYIEVDHTNNLNFDEDFAIVFTNMFNAADFLTFLGTYGTSTSKYNLISKNGEVPKVQTGLMGNAGLELTTTTTGSSQKVYHPPTANYPFDIYIDDTDFSNSSYSTDISSSGHLVFRRSDGENITELRTSLFSDLPYLDAYTYLGSHQYIYQKTGSLVQLYRNGILVKEETDICDPLKCNNNSPLYLFNGGINGALGTPTSGDYRSFPGGLTQFMVYNQALTEGQVSAMFASITGTKTIGNIFYDNGLAVITHPDYQHVFAGDPSDTWSVDYRNTHLIYEHEISCTVEEDEFNSTNNLSARKAKYPYIDTLANFATGSNFKPYVTTIGLYDDEGNLLVAGKLGQPVKMSNETDTTFVIRYDT